MCILIFRVKRSSALKIWLLSIKICLAIAKKAVKLILYLDFKGPDKKLRGAEAPAVPLKSESWDPLSDSPISLLTANAKFSS